MCVSSLPRLSGTCAGALETQYRITTICVSSDLLPPVSLSYMISVAPIPGAAPEAQYHNYLWEGVSGTLERVQGALKPSEGAVGDPMQLLTYAAEHLRGLAGQLLDVSEAEQLFCTVVPPNSRFLSRKRTAYVP